MKSKSILLYLFILIIIIALLSALLTTLQVVYGYTGFIAIRYKSDLVQIDSTQCHSFYFQNKYSNNFDIHHNISYLANLISIALTIVIFLSLVFVGRVCKKNRNRRTEPETAIILEQGEQQTESQNEAKKYAFGHGRWLWITYCWLVLVTYITFGKYIELMVEATNMVCPVQIHEKEVLFLTLVSGFSLLLSVVSLMMLLAANQSIQMQINPSINERIMSSNERPDTERVMYNYGNSPEKLNQHQMHPSHISQSHSNQPYVQAYLNGLLGRDSKELPQYSQPKSSENHSNTEQPEIKIVQSILYQAQTHSQKSKQEDS